MCVRVCVCVCVCVCMCACERVLCVGGEGEVEENDINLTHILNWQFSFCQ